MISQVIFSVFRLIKENNGIVMRIIVTSNLHHSVTEYFILIYQFFWWPLYEASTENKTLNLSPL